MKKEILERTGRGKKKCGRKVNQAGRKLREEGRTRGDLNRPEAQRRWSFVIFLASKYGKPISDPIKVRERGGRALTKGGDERIKLAREKGGDAMLSCSSLISCNKCRKSCDMWGFKR